MEMTNTNIATENTAAAIDAISSAVATPAPVVAPAMPTQVIASQKGTRLGKGETAMLIGLGVGAVSVVAWGVYGGIKLAKKISAKKAQQEAELVIDDSGEECPDYVEADAE